jgi:hypothetical protein
VKKPKRVEGWAIVEAGEIATMCDPSYAMVWLKKPALLPGEKVVRVSVVPLDCADRIESMAGLPEMPVAEPETVEGCVLFTREAEVRFDFAETETVEGCDPAALGPAKGCAAMFWLAAASVVAALAWGLVG